MKIQEANEDYLEALLILSEKSDKVRMSDVAKFLKVSKPSVNSAMNKLHDMGYIIQEYYGAITLTDAGKEYAEKIYGRHKLFKRFFIEVLNIDEEIADEEACHMEHCVSDSTMIKFEKFIEDQLNK